METKKTCPSCNGKGHVLDGFSLFIPFCWALAIGEKNDKTGFTRKKCPQCNGRCFIVW